MKLVIPGGSGFLGNILAGYFTDEGHEVVVLSRHPEITPWRQVLWNGRDLGSWAEELERADALINLAGRTVNCRYNEKNKAEIYASRLDSTRVLGQAIAECKSPPPVWLNSASATIYRHAEDREMDEATGEIGSGFSVDVCQKWEAAFFGCETPATRKVGLRSAMVMGPQKGGPFEAFYSLAKVGLGGPMGGGKQYVSWIHYMDFCRACEFLIDSPLDGVVNLAAPFPLTNASFLKTLREAAGIRFGLPLPRWMLLLGAWARGTEIELIVKSRRAVPGRLLEAGFEFEYPRWDEAVNSILSATP